MLLPSLSPTEQDENGTTYLNSCQLPVLCGSLQIPDAISLSSSKQSMHCTVDQRYCRTVLLANYTITGEPEDTFQQKSFSVVNYPYTSISQTGRLLSKLVALESKPTRLLSCFTLRNSHTHLSEVLFPKLLGPAFADSRRPLMFYHSAILSMLASRTFNVLGIIFDI